MAVSEEVNSFRQAEVRQESLSELIAKLSRDVTLLARQEVALAKQEASDKFSTIKAEAGGIAAGAVMLHLGGLVLVAALVLGLSEVLAPWLAALIVAVVLLGVGVGLLLRGKSRLSELDLAPKLVLENVERDVHAVKEAVR